MRASRAALLSVVVGCAGGGAGDGSSSTSTSSSSTTAALDCASGPGDLYLKRIEPLLATDRPNTCNTCHLSGVDLEMFVRETPCQTMACLNSRGLVDLDQPEASVILQWIARADPESPLIDDGVIAEEYEAFLAWIEATAACGICYDDTNNSDSPCGEPSAEVCVEDPEAAPYEDPGDCAPLTREALFRHNVYGWRDRCYPCHFDNTEFDAPKWIATGACELGSLMTMRNVLMNGLVDLDAPEASLLLLKPLAEGAGGVMHGGHDKFADAADPMYVEILAWIEREAACAP